MDVRSLFMRLLTFVCLFSCVVAPAFGQHGVRGFRGASWSGPYPVIVDFRDNMSAGTYEVRGPGGFEYVGPGATGNQYVVNNQAWYNSFPADGSRPYLAWRRISGDTNQFNPYTGTNWGAWQGSTNYFPPPVQYTNSFSWSFNYTWAGADVTVVDTNGNTVGQWAVPSTVGPEGYTLEASIIGTNDLFGAEVYINGYPVSMLAQAATFTNVERGALNLFVGPTYAGTNWSVTNSTGRVLTNGNDFSSVDNVTLPMFQGQTGRLNVGGQSTTVVILPGTTNYQTFYQPPTTAPQPTPVPTPVPITNDPNVTYPTPDTNGDVSFDPESWDYTFDPSSVLNAGASTLEQIKGATDNFSTGLANINQALDYMSGAIPSGSATSQCVFQFGTVTIDLSGFTTWRTPLKMFVLAAFVMAAIGIIRWSLETY